ncbi:MAG TPA: hypothetical protein VNJ52_00645 [Patescibacteria group bacterium]|nr:hypothetical protein [Patescibacteria group bacterium]
MAEAYSGNRTRLAEPARPAARGISLWVKIAATAWVAAWLPIYAAYYGWANFLHLSDIAILLTTIGLWTSSGLLISSQAVSVLLGETLWIIDVLWTVGFGHHLIGGTGYMWDHQYPLWLRLMSLYHFVLPALLVWAVARLGYDRRGLKLQAGIGAAALVCGRLWGRKDNINFAFHDPIFHWAWGPAPAHLLVMFAGMILLDYLPTAWLLNRLFGRPGLKSAA